MSGFTINDKSKLVHIFPENMDEKTQLKSQVAFSENFEGSLTLDGTTLQCRSKHLQNLLAVLNNLNIKICACITDYADV